MDVHRERKRYEPVEIAVAVGQVPSGTTKCTYKLGMDTNAKLVRDRTRYSPESFPRNPTDVVSSDPPQRERPFQGIFDKMVSVSKYEKNVPCSDPWTPMNSKVVSLNN